jgi:WD40 repeat protein
MSCTKTITNNIDRTVYQCGESARNEQSLVEILGPEGSSLSTMDGLEAALVSTEGKVTPLKVTEKGCVALPDRNLPLNAQLVVRQKTKDINLGRVLTEGPVETSLALAKISPELKQTDCKEMLYQSSGLRIPKKFESWISSRYLWKANLGKREGFILAIDGPEKVSSFFQLDTNDIKEKKADFTVTDLLTGDVAFLSCPLVVDQKAPAVSVSLARDAKYPFIKVDSNSQVDVSAIDDSPAEVFYCFFQPGLAGQCEFRKSTSTIKTPESGYWELHYYAIDQAGNKSVTTSVPLISWSKDTLENLRLIARSSLASGSDIEAIRLALTARKIWLDLKTAEEKAEVKDLVEYALFKAVNTRKERYRKPLNDLEDTVASTVSNRGYFKVGQSGSVSSWNFIDATSVEKSIGELPAYEDLMIRASRNGAIFVAGSSRKLMAFSSDLSHSSEIKMPLGSKAILLQPNGESSLDLVLSSGERYKIGFSSGKFIQDDLPSTGLVLNSAALTESRDVVVADSEELISVISGKDVSKKVTFPHGKTTGRFQFNVPIKRVGIVPGDRALFSLSTNNELKVFGPIGFEGTIPEMLAYKLEDDLRDGIFVGERHFVAIYPQKILTYDVFDKTISPSVLPIETPVLSFERMDSGLRIVTESRIFDLNPKTQEVRTLLERVNTKTYSVALSGNLVFIDQVARQQSPSRFIAGYDLSAITGSRIEIGAAVHLSEAGLIIGCNQKNVALADMKTLKLSKTNIPCDPETFDASVGKKNIFALTPRSVSGSVSDETGDTIVGGDGDLSVVRKFDFKGKLVGTLSHPDDGSNVTSVKVLPELGLILTGSDDGQIRVYEDSSLEPRNTIQSGAGRIVALHKYKDVIVVVGDNVVEVRKTLGSDETPIASITLDGEPLASDLNATGSLLIGGDQFSGILSVESSALKVDLRPIRYRVSAVDLDDKGNYILGLENGGIQVSTAGEGSAALSLHDEPATDVAYLGNYVIGASTKRVKIGYENVFHDFSFLTGMKRVSQYSDGYILSGESQIQFVIGRLELLERAGCDWLPKSDRPGICL